MDKDLHEQASLSAGAVTDDNELATNLRHGAVGETDELVGFSESGSYHTRWWLAGRLGRWRELRLSWRGASGLLLLGTGIKPRPVLHMRLSLWL